MLPQEAIHLWMQRKPAFFSTTIATALLYTKPDMPPSPHPTLPTAWPYPRWIAHRGAGKLAPENTLAAFQIGARHGYRMFECDVKLSLDGVPFLLHDDTLERTSNAASIWKPDQSLVAGENSWNTLSALDAGSWHSDVYSGQRLPLLQEIAAFCIAGKHFLNLEIKPSPGTDRITGQVVAEHVARLWQECPFAPLLTSFKVDALQGALTAHSTLPRGLLLDTLWDGWRETAIALQCVAIVCQHRLIDKPMATRVQEAGLRLLSYTVNDAATADRLLALGVDGLITDRVDYFKPDA